MKKFKLFLLIIAVALLSSAATIFALTSYGKNLGVNIPLPTGSSMKNDGEKTKGDADSDNNSKSSEEFFNGKVSSTLSQIYDEIQSNYYKDTDNKLLNEGVLRGIVESLGDPYSEYMNAEDYKKFNESTDGKYVGVGLIVSPGDDGFITVVSPIKGSPAYKAGIVTGDKVLKVNGVEYHASTMQDAVSNMRGDEGEKVVLTIGRTEKNENKTLDIEIIRESIKLVTVEGTMLNDGIGYISISEFDRPTYTDFVDEYKKLKGKDMKGLILDLRGNPGGLLSVSSDIADFFLDKGTIVYTEYKDGTKEYYYSDEAKEDIPMVVLVNGGSASASEIISGAFRDRERAKLIGTKTFGKGIVQSIFELSDGQAVKLTISEYFTPSGKNIHKIGIEPDIVVELPEGTKGIGHTHLDEDTQLQKAIEVLKGEI